MHGSLPVRMLGSVGYGRVGLWQKLSTTNAEVIDELAIKEQDRRKEQAEKEFTNKWYDINSRLRLLREAVVQRDLVAGQKSDYAVPLRR